MGCVTGTAPAFHPAHALRDAGRAGKKDAEAMARQYLGAGHEVDDVFGAARRDWQAFRAQGVLKELRRELSSISAKP